MHAHTFGAAQGKLSPIRGPVDNVMILVLDVTLRAWSVEFYLENKQFINYCPHI